MTGLLQRRRAPVRPEDEALAATLDDRVAAVRVAERRLAEAMARGEHPEQVEAARQRLDGRFVAAIEAAEAAYNLTTGDLESLSRVKQLARLVSPEVREADRVRRQLALARTHYQVAARDDLATFPIASVPPSVGTHATTLATHLEGH
jgi:hypothetical protein